MPVHKDDPRTALREQHRAQLITEIAAALSSGWSASHIGYGIANDPSFVRKLFNGHPFRLVTLLTASSRMHAFASPRVQLVPSPKPEVLE